MFNTDNPITQLKEDALGRSDFAKSLGEAILQYTDKSSISVGLFGGWGSGKTSVINMALDHIHECSKQLDDDRKPMILKFNPWNYSDQDQLILQFFIELSRILKRKDYSRILHNVGEKIITYGDFLTVLPIVGKYLKIAKPVGSILKKLGEKNISSLKNDLNESLSKLKQKIIIVIDDIDRLADNEIRQIFQLIKSLCDLNNTIYLLSFDKQVVVGALSRIQEGKWRRIFRKSRASSLRITSYIKETCGRIIIS